MTSKPQNRNASCGRECGPDGEPQNRNASGAGGFAGVPAMGVLRLMRVGVNRRTATLVVRLGKPQPGVYTHPYGCGLPQPRRRDEGGLAAPPLVTLRSGCEARGFECGGAL